jgi:hypothetical protein
LIHSFIQRARAIPRGLAFCPHKNSIPASLSCIAALEARLHELHSYQTPEFLVLGVEADSQPYLEWLLAGLSLP